MNIPIDKITALYALDPADMILYPSHEGGRNTVYRCGDTVLRITNSRDRSYEDVLSELEYVQYLYSHGAHTVNVLPSVNNRPAERVDDYYVSLFTLAKGDQIAQHGYRYLEDRPLREYFYNTGKVLGRIHALSKKYHPEHIRFDFFEKYNEVYFQELLPPEYTELKKALSHLLSRLRSLPRNRETYGMVHFDFSDGNYNIDYETGQITVFDFENCRRCFYLYDLANLWAHGVGWIAYERDMHKRKAFMEAYFHSVLEGYESETPISKESLASLPLMIQAVLMENIIDEFEVQRTESGSFEEDEEQAYRIECMVRGIEYMGFFDADGSL